MNAPHAARFANSASTHSAPSAIAGDRLLPWADPYIAGLWRVQAEAPPKLGEIPWTRYDTVRRQDRPRHGRR